MARRVVSERAAFLHNSQRVAICYNSLQFFEDLCNRISSTSILIIKLKRRPAVYVNPLPQVEEENFVASSWAASAETLQPRIIMIMTMTIDHWPWSSTLSSLTSWSTWAGRRSPCSPWTCEAYRLNSSLGFLKSIILILVNILQPT